MRFSVLATLATLGSGALSALTGVQVVQNIDTITTKSRVLIEPVKQLSIMNAPLLLIGQGPWPKVIFGLTDIVNPPNRVRFRHVERPNVTYVGSEATAIADAFRIIIKVHSDFLDVLIGKGGFIAQIPFVGPSVAALLRSIEHVVDAGVAAAMKAGLAGLDVKVQASITAFSV